VTVSQYNGIQARARVRQIGGTHRTQVTPSSSTGPLSPCAEVRSHACRPRAFRPGALVPSAECCLSQPVARSRTRFVLGHR
jgi:hypothetical protein